MTTEHLREKSLSSPPKYTHKTESNKQLTRNPHLNMNCLLGAGLLFQGKADIAEACRPVNFLSK